VWAAKKFNAYIYGHKVTFVTDHKPLVTMRQLKDPNGRIGRIFHKIQDLNYDLVYQPGKDNYTADLLLRPNVEVDLVEMEISSVVNWSAEQAADPAIGRVISVLNSNENGSNCVLDGWSKVLPKLSICDGILCVLEGDIRRIVVPQKLIKLLLFYAHDSQFAGHRDYEKIYFNVKSRYFWLDMSKQVRDYCETCHLCQTKKYFGKHLRAPLKPVEVKSS
jgi:hypothetical protein